MERYLIKFSKSNGAKFISHLDTLRTLHRALRRAEIPVCYSKGFNPHASISVAAPLSLGIASNAEYADIEIENCIDSRELADRMNNVLPEGIRILDAINVKEKMPPSMALVEAAEYNIILKHNLSLNEIEKTIKSILEADSIERMKKTKSGEKLVNIRPFIKDIKVKEYKSDEIVIECLLSAGSSGSLGADVVSGLMKEYSGGNIYGYPYITRNEIYTRKNGKWTCLSAYFTGM